MDAILIRIGVAAGICAMFLLVDGFLGKASPSVWEDWA